MAYMPCFPPISACFPNWWLYLRLSPFSNPPFCLLGYFIYLSGLFMNVFQWVSRSGGMQSNEFSVTCLLFLSSLCVLWLLAAYKSRELVYWIYFCIFVFSIELDPYSPMDCAFRGECKTTVNCFFLTPERRNAFCWLHWVLLILPFGCLRPCFYWNTKCVECGNSNDPFTFANRQPRDTRRSFWSSDTLQIL